jgi:hypothetical protein
MHPFWSSDEEKRVCVRPSIEGTTMAELKVCGMASSRERKGREGEKG